MVAAARGVTALVRYLNNASGPGNAAASLRYGPTVWRALGALTDTTYGLDQLLDQVSDALGQLADDETMYDDRGNGYRAADTAHEAASQVNAARADLSRPRTHLEMAHKHTAHLGHDL